MPDLEIRVKEDSLSHLGGHGPTTSRLPGNGAILHELLEELKNTLSCLLQTRLPQMSFNGGRSNLLFNVQLEDLLLLIASTYHSEIY